MQSKSFLCCTVKNWALVGGVLQTTFSVLALISFIAFLGINSFEYPDETVTPSTNDADSAEINDDPDPSAVLAITSTFLGVFTLLISLVAGIILLVGVIQENARKLKTWIIIEFIFLSFAILDLVIELVIDSSLAFGVLIQNISTILLNIFFIWIVNVHRKELIQDDSKTGWVSFRTGNI